MRERDRNRETDTEGHIQKKTKMYTILICSVSYSENISIYLSKDTKRPIQEEKYRMVDQER